VQAIFRKWIHSFLYEEEEHNSMAEAESSDADAGSDTIVEKDPDSLASQNSIISDDVTIKVEENLSPPPTGNNEDWTVT